MIVDHKWQPIVALIDDAIYLDTSGREAAKSMSSRHEGMKTGTDKQERIFFASYIVMAVMAIALITYSVCNLLPKL